MPPAVHEDGHERGEVGQVVVAVYGSLSRKTSPGRTRAPKKSRTDSTAHGMARRGWDVLGWRPAAPAVADGRREVAAGVEDLRVRRAQHRLAISSTMRRSDGSGPRCDGSSMQAVYAGQERRDPEEMGAERAGGERVVEPPIGSDKRAVANHRNSEVDAVVDSAPNRRRAPGQAATTP